MKKINKLLVANRGEIAIRVFRAATELKIRTAAIYTHEDRYSLHRYKADEGYLIGEVNDPLKPYLNIEEIIQTAKKNDVDAIHPGYGFLSENVQFARRCKEEGIIFVGPSAEIMEKLGDKVAAKKIARKVKVPIIESNRSKLKTAKEAVKAANDIGYPVMLKAASGGGGRGMRVVRNDDQCETSFMEARREAKNAFGDDTIFIEKFVEDPKHLEVQILGDQHGNLVHLFERDCSVQRRFQKVVEVAPSMGLKDSTRQKLYDYALAIAREVGYNNAGTVEFLVDPDENVFFIEVNPRIQVEHTVTEEVTGVDIVRSQILIAAGNPLYSNGIYFKSQEDIQCNGFAIQCRITTEDPTNNFKPDYGTIIAYRNAGGFGIRIDEGSSYPGVTISPFFDSMLAKVTARGRTLKGASARMMRTLTEFRIRGVKTNIPFLERVVENDIFTSGKASTSFIQNNPDLFDFSPKKDRGTKMLKYIADVTVNGSSDVRFVDTSKEFQIPIIPTFDRYASHPSGTKQLLTEKGPEEFSKWLKKEKKIHFTDTTYRDAHQSLIATRVRTRDLLNVAECFAKQNPELFSMEVWGGATFDVCLRFLKEDPWLRLKLLREAIPNICLQMLLRGSNAVGYTAYPDNLVTKFIEKAADTGIDIFRIFDSLNWIENMKVSIKAVRNQTNSIAEACICYTGDVSNKNEQKYTLDYYLDLAKQLEDAGAHIICIKDMAGLLKPLAAEKLIKALKKSIDLPIHLHTHDTSAAQLTTYMKAIDAGVDVVDVALESMSGLTSQPNFNTLNSILEGHKRASALNWDSLANHSDYWKATREYYYPFESGLKAGTAQVYNHEIPGGQYSNLGPQANSLGLAEKMNEITKAYSEVNDLFGNIVKVTPSSKVVGDMALYMVANGLTKEDIIEKGDEIAFPQSVKDFFKGLLGQPYGGFPKKLQKMVLKGERPMKVRANAHLAPVEFEEEFKKFKRKFGKEWTELDFISFKLYPKVFEQYVDHYKTFSNVSVIPTPIFFFGMEKGEEAFIELGPGKKIVVQLIYVSEDVDEDGLRLVSFRLNGQSRWVKVRDKSVVVDKVMHEKANLPNHIGSPIQGLLSKVFVKKGDKVKKNQPLFVMEAMKMETTITATGPGQIEKVVLKEGTMLDSHDLVVILAK